LSDAQRILQAEARELAESEFKPKAVEVDLTDTYPWDSVVKLSDAGFTGMTIPKAYGGRGLTNFDAILVRAG